MTYAVGERVQYPQHAEWGLGEILEVNGDTAEIFFVGAGKQKVEVSEDLQKITGRLSKHPVLDNLKKTDKPTEFLNIAQAIEFFNKLFPDGGFYGKEFGEREREYKMKAHHMAVELLNRNTFASLLKDENYEEITKRASKVVNSTNLLFANEKMDLRDGLKVPENQKTFSEALYALLFDETEFKDRFEAFFNVLNEIGAAKWTTASYFPFIYYPHKYMFVKPTVTKNVSTMCGFEINYKPQLNWLTYECVLKLSKYLENEISELNPRDMVDVQSFMWCIEKYE